MRGFLLRTVASTVLILALPLSSRTVRGQSLAEVARAEEARRKTAPKAAKVYTNQDLRPDARSQPSTPLPATAETSPSPEPAAGAEAPPKEAAAAPKQPEADSRKDEKYWRTRITEARDRLERSKLFVEALQSRINALTTDFVNRDDPAQRAVIGQERQKAVDELARVQNEIRDLTKAIADIEEEARKAGVPPGWLR